MGWHRHYSYDGVRRLCNMMDELAGSQVPTVVILRRKSTKILKEHCSIDTIRARKECSIPFSANALNM